MGMSRCLISRHKVCTEGQQPLKKDSDKHSTAAQWLLAITEGLTCQNFGIISFKYCLTVSHCISPFAEPRAGKARAGEAGRRCEEL